MTDPHATGALDLAASRERAPSADDAVAIGNLLSAYALYTDFGRRAELAGLFTPDATWDGTELGYAQAAGADAVVEAVLVHYDAARPMLHFTGPPLLVQTGPDDIEAYSWCIATRLADGVARPLIYFGYEDVIRRSGTGWRFAARRLRLRFRAT